MNRAGKGTQIELLSRRLASQGIPNVTLRGDGSREGLGGNEGDPYDEWWVGFRPKLSSLRTSEERFGLWNEAAVRLAREFLEFKVRLQSQIKEQKKDLGVILLDRTLISRLCLKYDSGCFTGLDSLYESADPSETFDWSELLPHVIIHLHVPQEILIERLEDGDPKYCFRKGLIVNKYDVYLDVLESLPFAIKERVVDIDGSRSIEAVHGEVLSVLKTRFPALFEVRLGVQL